jgi:hypothetical protein
MFLGIGSVRGISRRLLDGLHDSDVVRPNGYVEHENSSISLQESTPWFLLPGIVIDFVAMVFVRPAAVDLGPLWMQMRHLKCGLGAD